MVEREAQALLAVTRAIDRHPLGLEAATDEVEDPLLVVDHEDATDRSQVVPGPLRRSHAPTSPATLATAVPAGKSADGDGSPPRLRLGRPVDQEPWPGASAGRPELQRADAFGHLGRSRVRNRDEPERPSPILHGSQEIRTRLSLPGAMKWGSKRIRLVVDCLGGTFAPHRSGSCRDRRPKARHPRPAVGSSSLGGGCRHHRPRDRVGGRTGWQFPRRPRHGGGPRWRSPSTSPLQTSSSRS